MMSPSDEKRIVAMVDSFTKTVALSFVERITVLSRKEVVFEWKCGLSLKERLVEP